MKMSGHQQTIYTIHESQLNNGSGQSDSGQRASDLLIDTSSIPLTQQQHMPPMQHQHQLQPQQSSAFNQPDLAVTSQPGGSGSARVAPENQNVVYSVHPIFNMLDNHDTLLIRQKADCTSTCCGFESVNTYTVRSKDGQAVLKAIENSNCCERCCFEGNREYNLSLVHNDEVVARIKKPYRVSRFCCYSNSVKIESPEDNPIGNIKQMFTLFGHARYAIYDCQQLAKKPSFYLKSVSCKYCCTPLLCTCICGNKEFRIINCETKEEVGRITRQWSQEPGELVNNNQIQNNNESNNENAGESIVDQPFANGDANGLNSPAPVQGQDASQLFGVQFLDNSNLEARHKVLLLSACFMMDFFYFENDRRRRKLASC